MLSTAPRRLRVEHPNPLSLDDPAEVPTLAGMRWATVGDGLRAAVVDGQTEQDICMPSRAAPHLSLALMLDGQGHFAMGRDSRGARCEFAAGHAFLSWSAEHFEGVDFIPAVTRFRCVILQFRPGLRRMFDSETPIAHSGAELCRHATARAWVARLPLDAFQKTIIDELIASGLPASARDALHWECRALDLLRQVTERLRTPVPPLEAGPSSRLSARDRRALLAALRHIEQAYADPLRVDDLARIAGLGVGALQDGFKALFGHSVYAAVIEQRVAEASRLLRGSAVPVHEVAARCGFSNPSHLARHFKRRQGMTPAADRATGAT